jgi:hypothetical protein
MRIARESPDLLVVSETAAGLRVCGAVLGVTGAALVSIASRADSTPAVIAGACILLVGAMFALLPATSTFAFNRSEGRLIASRRHIWSRGSSGTEEFSLRDVVAVRAQKASFATDGESTWRIIVQLANGRTIPFESYYTSGVCGESRNGDADRGVRRGCHQRGSSRAEWGIPVRNRSGSLVTPEHHRTGVHGDWTHRHARWLCGGCLRAAQPALRRGIHSRR